MSDPYDCDDYVECLHCGSWLRRNVRDDDDLLCRDCYLQETSKREWEDSLVTNGQVSP